MAKKIETALTLSSISLEASHLLNGLDASSPTTDDGYPILTKREYRRKVANPQTRIESAMALFPYYYFRPVMHKAQPGYEVIPWNRNPTISLEESAPSPEALLLVDVFQATNDPYTAARLIARPTEATFTQALHPHVQLAWKAQLDALKNDPTNNAKINPVVRHLLTKEGQAAWFVNIALDPLEETKTRITAMVNAGRLHGHYSEKLQLLHEGLPDLQPQQVTNNIMIGADITNKFRLFLQDRLQLDAPAPSHTAPTPTVEEAEVIDVDEMPSFLQ